MLFHYSLAVGHKQQLTVILHTCALPNNVSFAGNLRMSASPELSFVPGNVLVWLALGLRQGSTALQPRDAARAAEGQLQSNKPARMSKLSSWEIEIKS